jgi:outer membrane scaffolding protein for murein synthesis (MipA/OmpV family)
MPGNGLTTIDLAVIALARLDPRSSLKSPRRLFVRLFGVRVHPPLASPRLEALRRYAILRRLHGALIAADEQESLRVAGYEASQIEAIDRLVAPPPAPVRRCVAVRRRHANFPSPPASTDFRRPKPARLSMLPLPPLPHVRPGLIAAATILVLLFGGVSAHAQSQNNDHIIIGAGAAYTPAYQGADDYRVRPLPAIDIAWGPFFANLRNGIGVNVIDTATFTAGGSVTFTQGYRRRDAPDGIGRLSSGAGGRLFASVRAAGFVATIGGTKGFAGGTKGVVADASLSYPIAVSSRFTLIPTIGTTWADRKHNDRYFGVDAGQSLASGLPQFHAGSGFKDASATLSAQYRLTDRISVGASGGVTSLLGKVKDSPIVFHKTQPMGFLSLSYRFGS